MSYTYSDRCESCIQIGRAEEKARIVAKIRERALRYATNSLVVLKDLADDIERGAHTAPAPAPAPESEAPTVTDTSTVHYRGVQVTSPAPIR